MKRLLPFAVVLVAACDPTVPDSGAPRETGVGFGTFESNDPEAFGIETNTLPISNEQPDTPAPEADTSGISDEQDFDAVSGRQTIESDAERLQRLRDEFEVVQPKDLPTRPGSVGPNIVEYALTTSHPVGTKVHSRFGASQSREDLLRRCAAYVSPDAAQRDFLERGGPRRDPRRLDPDGDGYACLWDPAPFRAASR